VWRIIIEPMWMVNLFQLYFFSFMAILWTAGNFTLLYCKSGLHSGCPKIVGLVWPEWEDVYRGLWGRVFSLCRTDDCLANKVMHQMHPLAIELFVYVGLLAMSTDFLFCT
jgi:hypothetical protein